MTSPYKYWWNDKFNKEYSPENAKECYCPLINDSCKGEICMMWRYNKKIKSDKNGYCGVAGKYEYTYGGKDFQ